MRSHWAFSVLVFASRYGVGRGCGVGRGLGVTLGVAVGVGVVGIKPARVEMRRPFCLLYLSVIRGETVNVVARVIGNRYF